MRDVLRKWTPREKYVKHQNFTTHFCLSLSLECSGEISRQSAESAYPINLVKVDVFLPKSYARFLLVKVRKQLVPRLEIREFKQITTDGATTAAVTEKVWGDYVSVVC